jgi:hypothetical protein
MVAYIRAWHASLIRRHVHCSAAALHRCLAADHRNVAAVSGCFRIDNSLSTWRGWLQVMPSQKGLRLHMVLACPHQTQAPQRMPAGQRMTCLESTWLTLGMLDMGREHLQLQEPLHWEAQTFSVTFWSTCRLGSCQHTGKLMHVATLAEAQQLNQQVRLRGPQPTTCDHSCKGRICWGRLLGQTILEEKHAAVQFTPVRTCSHWHTRSKQR